MEVCISIEKNTYPATLFNDSEDRTHFMSHQRSNTPERFKRPSSPSSESLQVTAPTAEIGSGLKALTHFKKDDFLIEYVGEVIPVSEAKNRLIQMAKDKASHMHMMHLGNAFSNSSASEECVIDAGAMGNMARFINHSCNPNAETIVWDDELGRRRVAVIALRPIEAGEEITFDYDMEALDLRSEAKSEAENQELEALSKHWTEKKCLCGERMCRGKLVRSAASASAPKAVVDVRLFSKTKTRSSSPRALLQGRPKPPPWTCPDCTFVNKDYPSICDSCGHVRNPGNSKRNQ